MSRRGNGRDADGPPPPQRDRREALAEAVRQLADPALLARFRHAASAATESLAGTAPGDVDVEPAEAAPSGSRPRPIAVWQPRETGSGVVWERPAPLPLGDHHAATPRLEPRRGPLPRRVCLLGESVAAGYLYAPALTPAKVLERRLAEAAGPGAWEVIDLARTDERLAGLAATAEAAEQLEPDLYVLFAGNNWTLLETPEVSPWAEEVAGRQQLADAWRAGDAGPEGVVGLARRRLAERAGAALERIAAAAARQGAPVVVVLPEVDLADWESRQPVLWLPAGDEGDDDGESGAAGWHRLYASATAALDAGDLAGAEAAAWAMSRLDDGSNPTPFRLLARAWADAGRLEEARDAALAEVDAVHYPLIGFLDAPRATSLARRLLERAVERHGWSSVDLRPLFASHAETPYPGRRLFLDYCHLTAEGMEVAMAATAAAVVERLGGDDAPASASFAAASPAPEVEATAAIGAAVHSAHRLLATRPRGPLLAHWLGRALAADPAAAAALVELAAARAAPAPAALTAAGRRLFLSPHRLGFQHGLAWSGLDGDLVDAALAALDAADPAAAAELRARLVEAAAGDGWIDLVAPRAGDRHLAEPAERLLPDLVLPDARGDRRPRRATFRAAWPTTRFELLVPAGRPLEGVLVARLPPIEGARGRRRGAVEIVAGSGPPVRRPLGEPWTRHRFRLAAPGGAGNEREGAPVRLVLRWPPPPPVDREALAAALDRLATGAAADLHPVFGEVASLRLRPA